MGYGLLPKNKDLDGFEFGAFSFGVVLEVFGYLYPSIHYMGRWTMVSGVDDRFNGTYPPILANDGFKVTAEESKIIARLMRNFVAIQRGIPEKDTLMDDPSKFISQEWPRKIREDWVDKIEEFADWSEKSKGFEIW